MSEGVGFSADGTCSCGARLRPTLDGLYGVCLRCHVSRGGPFPVYRWPKRFRLARPVHPHEFVAPPSAAGGPQAPVRYCSCGACSVGPSCWRCGADVQSLPLLVPGLLVMGGADG